MSQVLRLVSASLIKELRVWKRNPQKLVLLILLPLMFFVGFSMLMGGVYFGSGVETALVVEEENPGIYTEGLITILGQYDQIPPRLDPIQMDAQTADQLFMNGDILLVVIIPDGFEEALATNQSTSIYIKVANIHEDLTKNLRMPVIRKLDIFYHEFLPNASLVDFEVETLRPFTPPRLAYMAWTIAIYAVMFGSIYAAGSTMTQEFEQHTMDEITLSNQSMHFIFFGKMLSFLLFGVWPNGDFFVFVLLTLLLALFCSGVGLITGALLRNSVFIVPIAALSAIFYWIVGGGIAPLELVGSSFGIVNEYLPVSNVYRSLIRMFVEGSYQTLILDLSVIGIFALAFTILSPIIAKRVSNIDIAGIVARIRNRRR